MARKGARNAGKNSTDKGTPGTKCYLVVDKGASRSP
jgi:hypothetical protein